MYAIIDWMLRGFGDWFVIGGRWSEELTRCQLDQKKLKRLEKKFEKNYGWWTDKTHSKEKRLRQYTKLFMEIFPEYQNIIPHCRDEYAPLGSDDDAMIVNQVIYDSLLKQYEGDNDSEFHCVHDYEPVSKVYLFRNQWLLVSLSKLHEEGMVSEQNILPPPHAFLIWCEDQYIRLQI